MRYFILAIAAALAATPAALAAQANSCLLEYQNGPWTAVGDPANRVISADGPLLVKCAGGEELRADSAVIYQAMNEVHLFGQVDFQDPTRTLTADRAIYNSGTGRLFAQGNVIFTDKQRGSTLRGPELEYFKAMPGRPDAQAIATQRPHLTLVPRGGSGQRRDPMEIDGDRITSTGDKFMTAEGNVVIVSKDVRSTAATAFYDATAERMELRTAARVRNPQYELQGEYIESNLRDGKLTRVLSRTNARLDSERLDVNGPQLLMFFENDKLQRVVSGQEPQAAAPRDSTKALPRSVALASGFRMEADSLEAIMPGQELREVHAIGSAHGLAWDTVAVGAPGDTAARRQRVTTPPDALEDRDLILADTIIGYFTRDTTARRPARDSADAKVKIERLVAIGHARSVYRVRNDDAPAGQKPAINYLNADHVDLAFRDGEVDNARARGVHRGVYLDPGQPRAPADSAAAGAPAGAAGARPAAGNTAARTPTPGRDPAPGTPAATTGTAAQTPRPAPTGAPGRGTRIPTARPAAPATPAPVTPTPQGGTRP
jgi:lipopolysaccharide export system protein LptA